MRKLHYLPRNQVLVLEIDEGGAVRKFHFDRANFHYSCEQGGRVVVKHLNPSDEARLRPIMQEILKACAAGTGGRGLIDLVEATLVTYPTPKGRTSTRKVKVVRAPGYHLRNYLRLVCTKAFAERELDALVADGNEYYAELLSAKQWRKAEVYKWTLRGQMIWTVVGGMVSNVMKVALGKRQSSE